MWVKVDDRFTEHPKVRLVAERLGGGRGTRGRVLALWLAMLCHANRDRTGGFISNDFIEACWDDAEPLAVAQAMSEPITDDEVRRHPTLRPARPCLLIAEPGGYRIHDYGEYQRSPVEAERLRHERQRAGAAGGRRSGVVRRGRHAPYEANNEANGEANDEANCFAPITDVRAHQPPPESSGAQIAPESANGRHEEPNTKQNMNPGTRYPVNFKERSSRNARARDERVADRRYVFHGARIQITQLQWDRLTKGIRFDVLDRVDWELVYREWDRDAADETIYNLLPWVRDRIKLAIEGLPDMSGVSGQPVRHWQDECQELHGGVCGWRSEHEVLMHRAAAVPEAAEA